MSRSNYLCMSEQIIPDKSFLAENCPEFVSTGFERLDGLLGGGLTPNLIVLGALSSLGKSTLLLQMAQSIASGKPVLYFSLEMTAYRLAEKAVMRQLYLDALADNAAAPDARLLTNSEQIRKLGTAEWQRLKNAIASFRKNTKHLYVIDRSVYSGTFTVERVKEYVDAFIKTEGQAPVVIVDYLQLLRSGDKNSSLTERQLVDHNISTLWQLAHSKEHSTPVIAISSINRESYKQPISFSAFKESGGIEFSADIVFGLQYRSIEKKGKDFNLKEESSKDVRELELVLLKNRYGPSQKSVLLDFTAAYNHFSEVGKEASSKPKPAASESVPASSDSDIENDFTGMEDDE